MVVDSRKTNSTEAVVYIKVIIKENWHLYSQSIKPGGLIKTVFTFQKSKDYIVVGKKIEPKPIVKYENSLKMDVGYFQNQVIFQQKIKLNNPTAIVKGVVNFQVCDDKSCLPPKDVSFSVAVK